MTRSVPTIYHSFDDHLPNESEAPVNNSNDDAEYQNEQTERTRLLLPAWSSTMTTTIPCRDQFCCSCSLSNTQRNHCCNILSTIQPNRRQQQQQQQQLSSSPQRRPPTIHEFFFTNHRANKDYNYNYCYTFPPFTVQRYYRFQVTSETPTLSLYQRPAGSGRKDGGGACEDPPAPWLDNVVTAMIRRSVVLASHGTDETGQWILVSVGGRSGWVRKQEAVSGPFDDKSIVPVSSSCASHQASACCSWGIDGGYMTLTTDFVAYEAWLGNHQFYFQGRLMLGPDASLFLCTNAVCAWSALVQFEVILPQLVFLCSTSLNRSNDYNDNHSSPQLEEMNRFLSLNPFVVVWWMSAVGVILVFATLWMTALGDPGILPPISSPLRPPPPSSIDDASQETVKPLSTNIMLNYNSHDNNHSDRHVPPQASSLSSSRPPSPLRYCAICNLYQPPRSKHCHACNACVARMDHHCPWLGTCIGARNYAWFFGFLCSLTASAVLISVCTIYAVVRQFLVLEQKQQEQRQQAFLPHSERSSTILVFHGLPSALNHSDISWPSSFDGSAIHYAQRSSQTLWQTMCFMPFTFFLGIFFLASSWSLVSLLFYHVMIISQGQTTHERVRGIYYQSLRRRSFSRLRPGRGSRRSNKYDHHSSSNNIDESHAAFDAFNHRKQRIRYTTSNRYDRAPNQDDGLPESTDCHGFDDHTTISTWIHNPYDRGVSRNWWDFFMEPRPVSLLPADFSQHVIYTKQERPEFPWSTRESEEPTLIQTGEPSSLKVAG